MKNIKIGVIAPLTGRTAKMGKGVVESLSFVIGQRKQELLINNIQLDLLTKDDEGDQRKALEMSQECLKNDAVCIIGPCDSACVYEILASGICADCPIITPLATASSLVTLGAKNFFRLTTPDKKRVQRLVKIAIKRFPTRRFRVFALNDSSIGYSQQLKNDLIRCLKDNQCSFDIEEFDSTSVPNMKATQDIPSFFCSPSAETARVVYDLFHMGYRPQIFTFGSNTNLLIPELVDTLVVADLDREDTDIVVQELIEEFRQACNSPEDPSISAMNGITLIINSLIALGESINDYTIDKIRTSLMESWRSKTHQGLFGPIAFTPEGEMAGSEHLSVLQVYWNRGNVSFRHIAASRT
jgi:ABC-type branched-subunit amino acid transport system substrate-binding protein